MDRLITIFDLFDREPFTLGRTFYTVLTIVVLIGSLAFWIVRAIGLCRMAKKVGIAHGWFAFLPVLESRLLGEIADLTPEGQNKRTRYRVSFFVVSLIFSLLFVALLVFMTVFFVSATERNLLFVSVFAVVMILSFIAVIPYLILYYIVFHRVCRAFDPQNGVIWFVVSLVLLFTVKLNGIVDALAFLFFGQKTVCFLPRENASDPASKV